MANRSVMIGVITRAASRKGRLRKKSVTNERSRSTQPPTKPAVMPTATPMSVDSSVDRLATDSDVRAP